MKKFSLLAFLAATLLFTGCSQKSIEMNENTEPKSSESSLNTIDTTESMESSATMVDDTMAEDMAEVTSDGKANYFTVNGQKQLIESIYFGFNKYNLTEDMRSVASQNASKLSGIDASSKIKIEGNADEWGTDEYNYALGLKRAKVVRDALIADGIPANKISLVSFGESNPVCSDKNAQCWQKNRRSEYKPLP